VTKECGYIDFVGPKVALRGMTLSPSYTHHHVYIHAYQQF
jgi:hypothetical protein